MHHGTLQGPHQDESDESTKRKIKRVARAKGGLQDKIDEVSQWRQHPPVVWGTEPFVDHVARCRIAAHHTHVGKRSAHLKYQERTVAICVSHRPGLFSASRYVQCYAKSARSWFVAKTNLYGFCVYQALKRTERFGAILMSQFVPENSSSHCIGSQRGRQNASKSRITFRCREDRTLGSHRAHAYDMCERHL